VKDKPLNKAFQSALLARDGRESILAAAAFLRSSAPAQDPEFFPLLSTSWIIRNLTKISSDRKVRDHIFRLLGYWLARWVTPRELRKLAAILEADDDQPLHHEFLLLAYKTAVVRLPQNAALASKLKKSTTEWRGFCLASPAELHFRRSMPPTLAQVREQFVVLRGAGAWPNGKADNRMNYDRSNRRIIQNLFGLPLAKDSNRRTKKLGQKASPK